MSDLLALAQSGVKKALAAGASAAEVYVQRSRSTGLVASGPYVTPTASEGDGVGVRVAVDGRIGASGVLSHADIDSAIERAIVLSRRSAAAKAFTLPGPVEGTMWSREIRSDDEPQLALLQEMMDRVHGRPQVTFSQFILRRTEKEVAVANSAGRLGTDALSTGYVEAEIRVSRATSDRTSRLGLDVTGGDFRSIDAAAMLDPLVEEASRALDPEPLPRTMDRVLLHPSPTGQLLGLLGNAFSAALHVAGRDAFDAANPFSPGVEIVDDPTGRRSIDDEGTPTSRRTLVKDGAVVGRFHDARTAEQMGVEPTGNGYRKGVRSAVLPRPNRLALVAGDRTMEALLEELDEGVLVTQPLLGAFAADKMTADVTAVAPFAFYVRQGKVRHALPPTGVGGNAHRVFSKVHALGRDLRECPHARVPAIVAGGLTCAT